MLVRRSKKRQDTFVQILRKNGLNFSYTLEMSWYFLVFQHSYTLHHLRCQNKDGYKANLFGDVTDQHCMHRVITHHQRLIMFMRPLFQKVSCAEHCKCRATSLIWESTGTPTFSISYLCGLTWRTTLSSNTFLIVFSICLRKTWGIRPQSVLTVSRNLVWMG